MPIVTHTPEGIKKETTRCLKCLERNGGCRYCVRGYVTTFIAEALPLEVTDTPCIDLTVSNEVLTLIAELN